MQKKLRLGFLASHGGSNMQAIIDSIKSGVLDAIACIVISNNSDSGAAQRAKKEGITFYHISGKTHPVPEDHDKAILDAMVSNGVEIIILAGYMKKIGNDLLNVYKGKILNIHPALLPKFGGEGMYGMKVHEAVIRSGEKVSGPTVHVVDEVYDNGRILAQTEVPVMAGDNPESLAERVLAAEHKIYSETLQKIAIGKIVL